MSYDTLWKIAFDEHQPRDLGPSPTSVVRPLLVRLGRYHEALLSGDAAKTETQQKRVARAVEYFLIQSALYSKPGWAFGIGASTRQQWCAAELSVRQVARDLNDMAPDLSNIESCRGELRVLTTTLSRSSHRRAKMHNWWKRIVRFAIVGAICSVGIATFYLGLADGFSPIGTQVLLPPAPHRTNDSGIHSAVPANLYVYFAEFSKHYFGVPSGFPNRHFYPRPDIDHLKSTFDGEPNTKGDKRNEAVTAANDAPEADTVLLQRNGIQEVGPKEHHQLWRVTLKNDSVFRSQFVGTLRVDLRLSQSVAFPWTLLNVKPKILISHEDDEFVLANRGLGPAVKVQWSLRNGDRLILDEGHESMIYGSLPIPYLDSGYLDSEKDVNSWPIHDPKASLTNDEQVSSRGADQGTQLGRPLFFRRDSNIDATGDDFFIHDGKSFEIISSVERLAEITLVEHRSRLTLNVAYESVSGKQYYKCSSFDLPHTILYYKRMSNLLERDPRLKTWLVQDTTQKTMTYAVTKSVAQALVLPPLQPEGVDLLVESVSFVVPNLGLGETQSDSVEINRFVNPSGHIVIYLLVTNPINAHYEATVYVNGRMYHSFAVETLVPPELTFADDYNMQDAVERLSIFFEDVSDGESKTPKDP